PPILTPFPYTTLFRSALERIGPVDDVPPDRQREVSADRPRFGLRGIRLAHHLPHDGDGPVALEDHRDDWPRGNVRHERFEEGLRSEEHTSELQSPDHL